VHNALDAPFGIGFDGHDVTAASHRDDRFLQPLVLAGVEQALEFVLDTAVYRAQIGANPAQLGAGAVQHFAAFVDGAADGVYQARHFFHQLGNGCQVREAIGHFDELPLEGAGGHERAADVQQILGGQGEAAPGIFRRAAHVARAADGDVGVGIQQQEGFGRFFLPLLGQNLVGGGLEFAGEIFASAEAGVTR